MTPDFVLREIIDPGLAFLNRCIGPHPRVTDEARVILLAIASQQSGLADRMQTNGCRSFFGFSAEHVDRILRHPTSGPLVDDVLMWLAIPRDPATVFDAIKYSDLLAVAMARTLLLIDPYPIPADKLGARQCYLRLWAATNTDEAMWNHNFDAARAAVKGTP